jgi:hypothetical protein
LVRTTKQTARLTGIAYLALAISGIVGFFLIRSQLFVRGDANATAANLIENEGLARLGIAVDLTIVLTQSLAALLFFRLFRHVNAFAAGSIAAFGLMNSAAILVATACSATALNVALDGGGTRAAGDGVLLLYDLNDAAWGVGGIFFGLWLIPMGWLAWRSGYMPRLLGWILVASGVGYVLSAYAKYLLDVSPLVEALAIPATIGEIWMVVYLLVWGVRSGPDSAIRAR